MGLALTVSDREIVTRINVFRGLNPAMIERLIAPAVVMSVREGETIFQQGEPGTAFFIVLEGWVKLYRIAVSGEEAVINVFAKGDGFAEAVAFTGRPYPATAEAVSPARLVRVPADHIVKCIRDTPEIALAMLIGILLPLCHSPGGSRRWLAIASCVLLAAHITHTWRPGIQMIIRKQPPDAKSRNNADAVLLAVNETKGEVLGEDAIFPILDHRPVIYQPFIMTQLSQEGKWNQDAFVQDLRRGRFSLILTMNCLGPDCVVPGFTQEMRSAILERYELQGAVPLYPNQQRFFYTPKPITSESP